jgi:hypothetical protein
MPMQFTASRSIEVTRHGGTRADTGKHGAREPGWGPEGRHRPPITHTPRRFPSSARPPHGPLPTNTGRARPGSKRAPPGASAGGECAVTCMPLHATEEEQRRPIGATGTGRPSPIGDLRPLHRTWPTRCAGYRLMRGRHPPNSPPPTLLVHANGGGVSCRPQPCGVCATHHDFRQPAEPVEWSRPHAPVNDRVSPRTDAEMDSGHGAGSAPDRHGVAGHQLVPVPAASRRGSHRSGHGPITEGSRVTHACGLRRCAGRCTDQTTQPPFADEGGEGRVASACLPAHPLSRVPDRWVGGDDARTIGDGLGLFLQKRRRGLRRRDRR